jgi:hypothetical protein
LRKLLAGYDEAILDPLDTRCLSARGRTSQAASGLRVLVVRGRGMGVRHSGSNTPRPWQLDTLLADGRAQAAQVFAETPNRGLKLRDAAQQDGSAEIGAHGRILSKAQQPSKCSKWSKTPPLTGDRRGSSLLVLTTGGPSPKPAEHALNKRTQVAAMPISMLSGIALPQK